MNKITKDQAAEIASDLDNCRDDASFDLPDGELTCTASNDQSAGLPIRLEIDGWLSKADLTSLIRVLKAIKATLP